MGIMTTTTLSDYAASKHGSISITETLAMEMAEKAPQLRFHVCLPCLVRTGLMVTSRASEDTDPAMVQQAMEAFPDHGLLMTPTNHGHQVWDRIAAGEFYMICDNI